MKKLMTRIAESYAKSSTTSCDLWLFHAPKTPRSLVK